MKKLYWLLYAVLFFVTLIFVLPIKADFCGKTGFLLLSLAKAEVYDYYVPYALSNKDYWTGLALKNGSSTDSASVVVTGIKQNGCAFDSQVKTIPPLGQIAFMMNSGEGWVKVNSDQSLTGLAFVAESAGDALMFDMTLIPDLAKTLYVPHVAQDATWDTIVYVCNPNGTATTMYLTFVKSDGTVVTSKSYTLGVNASGAYPLSNVVGGGKYSSGSIQITASQGVAAFALYQNLKTGAKSYAGVSAVKPEEPLAPSVEEAILGNFIFVYASDVTVTDRITINRRSANKTSEGTYFYEGYDADNPSRLAMGAWYPSKSKYMIEIRWVLYYQDTTLTHIYSYTFSINPDNTLTGYYQHKSPLGIINTFAFITAYKEPLGAW